MAPVTTQSGKIAGFGPHSRKTALSRMDKRSAEGRHLRRVREGLIAHLGSKDISFVQNQIIERAAWLSLHIALFDAKVAAGHEPTQVDVNTYISWTNTYQKALLRLSSDLVPKSADSSENALAEYIAARAEVAQERQE